MQIDGERLDDVPYVFPRMSVASKCFFISCKAALISYGVCVCVDVSIVNVIFSILPKCRRWKKTFH